MKLLVITRQQFYLIIALTLLHGSQIGCSHRTDVKRKASAPVKASFVLSKLPYGSVKDSERAIWCFHWENQSYIDYPRLCGSMKKYRTLAWEREAVGGDRIFQTYDLVSDQMGHTPVSFYKNGVSLGYQGNGWLSSSPKYGQEIRANQPGVKIGELEIRLDGVWKKVTDLYARGLTSADGPRLTPGKYTFDAFFGDVVVIMRGHEILRQQVERITELDLNEKCQSFPAHDLFVFFDGIHDRPGIAWFLDLTLGHPRPSQGPNDIFPSRVNTLPTIRNSFDAIRVDGIPGTQFEGEEKIEIDVPYRICLHVDDPDFEYGDEITRCDWEMEFGKIVTTGKPELIFTFRTKKMYKFWFRAYDKSRTPGPWCGTSVPAYMFEKDIPNTWHVGSKQPPVGTADPRQRLPPDSRAGQVANPKPTIFSATQRKPFH